MPHIVATVRSGYSNAQKRRLADALSAAAVESLDCPRFDVSIGIEEGCGCAKPDTTQGSLDAPSI